MSDEYKSRLTSPWLSRGSALWLAAGWMWGLVTNLTPPSVPDPRQVSAHARTQLMVAHGWPCDKKNKVYFIFFHLWNVWKWHFRALKLPPRRMVLRTIKGLRPLMHCAAGNLTHFLIWNLECLKFIFRPVSRAVHWKFKQAGGFSTVWCISGIRRSTAL